MPFLVKFPDPSESTFNREDYAPAGVYIADVQSVKPYEGTKYQSIEPQLQARITWVVAEGPCAGKIAERLYNASLHPSSKLYPIFVLLTGITPDEQADLELMQGRRCQIVVMDHIIQQGPNAGQVRTRVENVLAIPATAAPVKAKRTRVIEVEDDDDDDLSEA